MNVVSTMRSSVEVWRDDGTTNALGEKAGVLAHQFDTRCSYHVGRERDRRPEAGLQDRPFYVLHFPRSVTIQIEDEVRIGSLSLRVASIEYPHGRVYQFQRAIAQEVVS